jgi:hypothetical protein
MICASELRLCRGRLGARVQSQHAGTNRFLEHFCKILPWFGNRSLPSTASSMDDVVPASSIRLWH